jgi:hypothetical protein
MTDYDGEWGGRGLLGQMTVFAVSGGSGVNIKFHVPTLAWRRQSRLAAWRVPLGAPPECQGCRVQHCIVICAPPRVITVHHQSNIATTLQPGLRTGLAFAA